MLQSLINRVKLLQDSRQARRPPGKLRRCAVWGIATCLTIWNPETLLQSLYIDTYQQLLDAYKTLKHSCFGKISQPLCCWWLIWQIQNDAKTFFLNDWNPGTWVLIWECSARAIQWKPTWQDSDVFQKSVYACHYISNPALMKILKNG